jgi:hypothetical protein
MLCVCAAGQLGPNTAERDRLVELHGVSRCVVEIKLGWYFGWSSSVNLQVAKLVAASAAGGVPVCYSGLWPLAPVLVGIAILVASEHVYVTNYPTVRQHTVC